jgi:hypothetical protein
MLFLASISLPSMAFLDLRRLHIIAFSDGRNPTKRRFPDAKFQENLKGKLQMNY